LVHSKQFHFYTEYTAYTDINTITQAIVFN